MIGKTKWENMKYIIFGIFLISCQDALSQATNRIDSIGNVGIGTISPAAKLTVVGSTILGGHDNTNILNIERYISSHPFAIIRAGSVSNGVAVGMNLQTRNSSGSAIDALNILGNGNVGIGTINPLARLSVAGSLILGEHDATNVLQMERYHNSFPFAVLRGGSVDNDVPVGFDFQTRTSTGVTFDALTILGNGNVGIGKTDPTRTLDVFSASAPGIAIGGTASNSTDRNLIFTNSSNNISGSITLTPNTTGTNSLLQFFVGGFSTGDQKMVIDDDGNVGIGTGVLSEKLSVNGNIKAKKIIVSQLGWSDYVFNETYKLRSLSSLESFIKENKHLPEVPSAKEVEENGISVGDNQALLLKKIEELTLYIIKLKNSEDQLIRRVNALELKRDSKKK